MAVKKSKVTTFSKIDQMPFQVVSTLNALLSASEVTRPDPTAIHHPILLAPDLRLMKIASNMLTRSHALALWTNTGTTVPAYPIMDPRLVYFWPQAVIVNRKFR